MDWITKLFILGVILLFILLYLKDKIIYFKDAGRKKDIKAAYDLFNSIEKKLGFGVLPDNVENHFFYYAAEQYFYSRYVNDAYKQILEAKDAFNENESLANLYSLALYKHHVIQNIEKYNNVSFEGYLLNYGTGYFLTPYPVISTEDPNLPTKNPFLDAIGEYHFESRDACVEIPFTDDCNKKAEQQIRSIYENQRSKIEMERVKVTASISTTTVFKEGFLGSNPHTEKIIFLSNCDVHRI